MCVFPEKGAVRDVTEQKTVAVSRTNCGKNPTNLNLDEWNLTLCSISSSSLVKSVKLFRRLSLRRGGWWWWWQSGIKSTKQPLKLCWRNKVIRFLSWRFSSHYFCFCSVWFLQEPFSNLAKPSFQQCSQITFRRCGKWSVVSVVIWSDWSQCHCLFTLFTNKGNEGQQTQTPWTTWKHSEHMVTGSFDITLCFRKAMPIFSVTFWGRGYRWDLVEHHQSVSPFKCQQTGERSCQSVGQHLPLLLVLHP